MHGWMQGTHVEGACCPFAASRTEAALPTLHKSTARTRRELAGLSSGTRGQAKGSASSGASCSTTANQAVRPRPLKKLASAFAQLADDVRYKRIDVATARVTLSALDRELRCLEI